MDETVSPFSAAVSASATASIDELDAAIGHMACRINEASYKLLVLVREFDDRFGWAQWGFRNCSEWLAWRCGLSLSAAREKVRTAQAMRSLPALSAAFGEGRLSYSKVRAMTRVAQPHDEAALVGFALHATAAQVEERCRQMRNVQPESVDDARRAWERRSLTMWRNRERGTITITVEVPAESGELVARALDRAVEAGEAASGPEFEGLGWQAQQADALVAVARTYLSGEAHGARAETPAETPDPASAAPASPSRPSAAERYQVVVHVDAAALRGGPGRSDLPLDVVKRLGCDASVMGVVENARGSVLNLGRKQRTVSAPLRRALWARDRGCAFPGCHNTLYTHAHHIRHWMDGGETSLANTILLCTHHHALVHEGGYRIGRDTDGALYFQRADGRVVPRCGFRVDDARPDPVHLADTSAEGWLADLVSGTKPSAEVRERAPPAYDFRAANAVLAT